MFSCVIYIYLGLWSRLDFDIIWIPKWLYED